MPKEKNMKISVQNYGPIAEAKDIELCPLTVFVGPSNTGKSYLAILIYALFKSFEPHVLGYWHFYKKENGEIIPKLNFQNVEKHIDNFLEEVFKKNIRTLNLSSFPKTFKELISKQTALIIRKNFHDEISRCIGDSETNSSLTKGAFSVSLEDAHKKLSIGSLQETPTMEVKQIAFFDRDVLELYRPMPAEIGTPNVNTFIDLLLEGMFHQRDLQALYLPAARTGIIQSQRAIAKGLAKSATLAVPQDFPVPTLNGITSDFLQEIITLHTKGIFDPDMQKIANKMEKEILHGSIHVEDSEEYPYPQYIYKQKGIEIPLLQASSMVSELAPLVLFIRYKIDRGDLLIIEEPESHLHPEAQRNIAKAIVRIVRAGVRVMVTTHSDYFLEQLDNYVRIAKLPADEREVLIGSKNLFLEENEIGAYVFNEHPKGTIVKRLKFENKDGLSPEDHNKVSSDLYNETVDILDQIEHN